MAERGPPSVAMEGVPLPPYISSEHVLLTNPLLSTKIAIGGIQKEALIIELEAPSVREMNLHIAK